MTEPDINGRSFRLGGYSSGGASRISARDVIRLVGLIKSKSADGQLPTAVFYKGEGDTNVDFINSGLSTELGPRYFKSPKYDTYKEISYLTGALNNLATGDLLDV
ncbi:hypothetical protein MNBD_GAMMA12-1245 [hydrothermal vent metagenome]|uniref:Uncharacterized protein n=1 Tax=hydrothermal vent metagenome TaxID=652676 RepID=A0A3B0YRI8_9ZZZZ